MIGIARGLFKSNVKSGSGVAPFDPDAQTFITAANITDTTQQSAVNQLVLDLKSIGVWTKEKAIYPVLGGSASSHAVNLKQPGTYNLSFATGWTHSNNGMLPNGATYADTSLIPNNVLTLNNSNFSVYLRTDVAGGQADIGVQDDMGPGTGVLGGTFYVNPRTSTNQLVASISASDAARISVSNLNSKGLFQTIRRANNSLSQYKNANLIATQTATASGFQSRYSVPLAVFKYINDLGVIDYNTFSTREQIFASIGDGLTDTEAVSKTVAVQKYQRALGRAVDMEIQVGTGAARSYYTPFSFLNEYSISGNIYLQSEVIGAAIPILGIEMYFSGFTLPYSLVNQEIYLAHVTQSQFDSAPAVDFSDLTLSDLTLVKASFTFTAANNAWVRMNFDTPFQYNGTSNILVIWKNNRGTWSSGGGGSDTHTSTSRSMYKVSSTGQPTGNGTLTNNRSNIKFIW